MKVVKKIYSATADFPTEEKYGLTSQLRRAWVSIVSNIAEWNSKKSDKHFVSFLESSLWSIFEVETQLEIAKELSYMQDINNILSDLHQLWFMIQWLIKKLSSS